MTPGRQRWTILSQYYRPEIGAPQLRLAAVARGLQDHGHEVRVVTGMPNYPTGRTDPGYRRRLTMRELIDGVEVRRCWLFPASGRGALGRLANYLSFTITSLFALLFGRRPDVLVVEGQPLTLGLVATVMRRIRGVPFVYIVPDLQVDVARQLGFVSSPQLLRWAEHLEDRTLRRAASVATVTRSFESRLIERGTDPERMTFLPNGADPKVMRPQPPDAGRRHAAGLGDRQVITYVGTFSPYHDLDTVLAAAARLAHDPDVVFWLLGQGSERPRLEALAATWGLENVVFGSADPDELAEIYALSDLALASLADIPVSRQMRLAKVFPALSCGVPVVLAGAGEGAELIDEAGCGRVVPPGDPGALATALTGLLADPELRSKQGRAGRELILRDYSWPDIIEQWIADLGDPTVRP
jgi:colanic acid biosynthesis glycosyl transferase WcaI